MNGSTTSDKPGRRPPSRQRRRLRSLLRDRRAATAVEYGFILALIVIAMMASLNNVGNVTTSMWNNINSKVTNPR